MLTREQCGLFRLNFCSTSKPQRMEPPVLEIVNTWTATILNLLIAFQRLSEFPALAYSHRLQQIFCVLQRRQNSVPEFPISQTQLQLLSYNVKVVLTGHIVLLHYHPAFFHHPATYFFISEVFTPWPALNFKTSSHVFHLGSSHLSTSFLLWGLLSRIFLNMLRRLYVESKN